MTERSFEATMNGRIGTLVVDGHDLTNGVAGFTLTARHGELPELEVTPLVIVGRVRGDEAKLTLDLPDEAREALIAAGWTPPPDDA